MYIVYQDLFFRYPEIKDWSYTEAHVNSYLIFYAEAELNSRLSTHFTVPFSDSHPTIKDLALDLSFLKGLRTKDPDRAEKIEKAVLGRLDDIKAGKENILTASGTNFSAESPSDGIWSSTMDYPSVHSMLSEDNPYTKVSSAMLDDLEQERRY